MKVSFVLPAYNEEESIGATINEIKTAANKLLSKGLITDYEIVIVDNNSKDRTKEIAESFEAKVVIEKKQGYGAAYKTGFKKATGDVIITGDSDGSYPFIDLDKFFEEINNYDFITTNRFHELQPGSMPIINYIGNKILTLTTNILFGAKLKDSQSGMWIFNKEFLNEIDFELMGDGMPFSEQIKLFAIFLNKRVKEIPITYRKRVGKKKLNALKDGLDNFLALFRFKHSLKKRYLKTKIKQK